MLLMQLKAMEAAAEAAGLDLSGDGGDITKERISMAMDLAKAALHEENHYLCSQALDIYTKLAAHSHEGELKYHHFDRDGNFGVDRYGNRSEQAMKIQKLVGDVTDAWNMMFNGAASFTVASAAAAAVALF